MRTTRISNVMVAGCLSLLLAGCVGGQGVTLAVPQQDGAANVFIDKALPAPPEQKPNLTPQDDLTARVDKGGAIQLTVTLHNGGGAAPIGTRLAVILVGEDDDEKLLDSVSVPALKAGGDFPVKLTIPAAKLAPDDELTLRVEADADGALDESDEDDNDSEVDLAYGADLEVSRVRIDRDGPTRLIARGSVGNRGNLFADKVPVKLQFRIEENGGGGGDYKDVEGGVTTVSLGTNEATEVKFPFELTAAHIGKIVDLRIIADPDNKVAELDEDDNSDNADYWVTATPGPGGTPPGGSPAPGGPAPAPGTGPDITVAGVVDVTDDDADNYVLTAAHGNSGAAETGAFTGKWTIKSPAGAGPFTPNNGEVQVNSVKAGEEFRTDSGSLIKWKPSDAAKGQVVTFEYEADHENKIAEVGDGQPAPDPVPENRFASAKGNNINNTYKFQLKVPPDPPLPDLAVEFTAELSGDKKKVRAFGHLQNLGTLRAKPATYQWYVNDKPWKDAFKMKNPLQPGMKFVVKPLEAKIPEGAKDKVEVRLVAKPGDSKDADAKNDKEQHTLDLDRKGSLLAVTSVRVQPKRSPDQTYCDVLIVSGRIKNVGDQSAKKFAFAAYVNGKKEKERASKNGLKAHRSRLFKFRVPLAAGVADKPIKVAFALEGLKAHPSVERRRETIVIVKGLPKPEERRFDMVVSKPKFRAEGGKRFLDTTVRNLGPHRTTDYTLLWYVDGNAFGEQKIRPGLDPRKSVSVSLELQTNQPSYEVSVTAPARPDLVGDVRVKNNTASAEVTVRTP